MRSEDLTEGPAPVLGSARFNEAADMSSIHGKARCCRAGGKWRKKGGEERRRMEVLGG